MTKPRIPQKSEDASDGWGAFERAVDAAVKSGPRHRTAGITGTGYELRNFVGSAPIAAARRKIVAQGLEIAPTLTRMAPRLQPLPAASLRR
jgi:hypothetical protein